MKLQANSEMFVMLMDGYLACAAGGALSPNGVLSPRARDRQQLQETFGVTSDPAGGNEPGPAPDVETADGAMAGEQQMPPMTPAEAQVKFGVGLMSIS